MRIVPRLLTSALIVVSILPLACPVRGALPGYARRVWHAEDGLPEETVQAFAQTPDHFLWVGTTGGLVRFDGAQFIVFDRENTPAIHENSIFCLLAAADGTLWIGTEGGGVVSYRNRGFRLWSRTDGLNNGYIRALREDSRGRIWIGTDDGLYRWEAGKIERVDGRNGMPEIAVHAIYRDRQQRLWVGGYHFFRFDDDRATELRLPGGLTDNVKSILQSRDGTLWVGTVSGLQRSDSPLNSASPTFSSVKDIHSTVRTLLEDDDGTLWIGTIGDGLIRYQSGRFSTLTAGGSIPSGTIPSNTILSSFSGSEHNIWIGTQAGLVRLNKTAAETVVLPDFAGADFGTVYSDRDGTLWVSSTHLFHITGRRAQMIHLPGPLANVRIRDVFRDSTGTLWFGTEGRGAFRWVKGRPIEVPLIQPYVRGFAEDREGGIWIGTDGGYCRWRPTGTRCFEAHESVRALYVDRQGDVWIGKDRGLTRLRNSGEIADSPIPRLRHEKVWAIHEDPEGALWFGTRTGGLFRWKSGQLSTYTTAQGLASNSIYQILEDSHGALWLSGPNGVSSIARRDLEITASDPSHRPAVKLYGTSEGLESTQMYGGVQPAGSTTASGEVWFPSTVGAVRIGEDPGGPVSAPPAVIYRVEADGRDVRADGVVELPPGQGKLDIEYGAIQFRSQERVRFRYQLEGFDSGWTETRVRRASYTNVPAGHYRFHLLAFDIAQPDATSEASVSFDWRPHFYHAWWFYVLCAGCLGGAVWLTYRARMRQAHARFEAVLGERNRLAREMHDTLIQGCTGVSAVLEAVASMSSEPAAARNLLDCARTQIRAVTEEAREAVWNLHRGGRSEIGSLVDQMARQACAASQVPVRFEASGKPIVLDPMIEHDILMVAREAVYNAIRHAHPQEVSLKVHYQRGRIRLSVMDDGCGFEPDEVLPQSDGHFGLIGMRERTERLGGRFAVRSAPGKGTELCVDVPVRAPAREKQGVT
jgi:ligand-binding sensor domain-containing protein/signal transduction histidine kinase